MPVTDQVADMLTIVRNGVMAHKEEAIVKRSKLNESIVDILKREGFIANYKTIEDKMQGLIKIYLKYDNDKSSMVTGLKRISKPGLRVFVGKDGVKSVYGGIGIAIISTSKGLMTDAEARAQKLGGEIICEVW